MNGATGGTPPVIDPARWGRLAEVLAALAPDERRAVVSVYFEGRTFRETAELLATDVRGVSRVIASAGRPVAALAVSTVET